MAQPYIGEIRMFAGNFPPVGWMFCEGQLLPISENETLFNLIGTTYGGDGQSTFALPDLRGRVPVHVGNGFQLAQAAGVEDVTLTVAQLPAHTHGFMASKDPASQSRPPGTVLASNSPTSIYRTLVPPPPAGGDECIDDRADGWESAAHQLPAVPVCGFHHLAVRDLPVPNLER